MFTFNECDLNDLGWIVAVVITITGYRPTYAGLTAKE
jgi:hypothetical protein